MLPISATGNNCGSLTTQGRPRRGRGAGFTLLEILVVVAITGIVIALAAVNLLPSDNEIARRESGNVALAIEGARDAAWSGGRPMAVTFEEGGVRAWRYSGGEWRADAARNRNVDANLRITSIYVDGQPLALESRLPLPHACALDRHPCDVGEHRPAHQVARLHGAASAVAERQRGDISAGVRGIEPRDRGVDDVAAGGDGIAAGVVWRR